MKSFFKSDDEFIYKNSCGSLRHTLASKYTNFHFYPPSHTFDQKMSGSNSAVKAIKMGNAYFHEKVFRTMFYFNSLFMNKDTIPGLKISNSYEKCLFEPT